MALIDKDPTKSYIWHSVHEKHNIQEFGSYKLNHSELNGNKKKSRTWLLLTIKLVKLHFIKKLLSCSGLDPYLTDAC